MRLGNPALRRIVRKTDSGEFLGEADRASYKGIYLKAALYAVLTIICAVAVEFGLGAALFAGEYEAVIVTAAIILGVSFIPLIVVALIIAFVPSTVKVLGFVYAAIQGCALGMFALIVDLLCFPGISFAAFLGTAIVFLVALVVNSLLRVKISSNFVKGLMVAFISLILVQLIMWVLSLFTSIDYTTYMWIQIAISALCVIWATLMLFFDLQNIDYVVATGAEKKYEWYMAFSLVTTLIYLYVEILELLLRLLALFSSKRR